MPRIIFVPLIERTVPPDRGPRAGDNESTMGSDTNVRKLATLPSRPESTPLIDIPTGTLDEGACGGTVHVIDGLVSDTAIGLM